MWEKIKENRYSIAFTIGVIVLYAFIFGSFSARAQEYEANNYVHPITLESPVQSDLHSTPYYIQPMHLFPQPLFMESVLVPQIEYTNTYLQYLITHNAELQRAVTLQTYVIGIIAVITAFVVIIRFLYYTFIQPWL